MNIVKNKILILFIAVTFFAVFLSIYFYKLNKVENVNVDIMENKESKTAEVVNKMSEAEKEEIIKKGREAVSQYEFKKEVVKSLNEELCEEIKDENYRDDCIFEISSTKGKGAYCDKINNDKLRIRCGEIDIFFNTISGDDGFLCYKLRDNDYKAACLNSFFVKLKDEKQCSEFDQKDQDRCSDIVFDLKSRNEKVSDYCTSIKDEALRKNCESRQFANDRDDDGISDSLEKSYGTNLDSPDTDSDGVTDGDEMQKYRTNLKIADTDGDGLSDGEEINSYKTDPVKADTDNDGYSDGEEIGNGHNPLER